MRISFYFEIAVTKKITIVAIVKVFIKQQNFLLKINCDKMKK